jgi:hypothetical protein
MARTEVIVCLPLLLLSAVLVPLATLKLVGLGDAAVAATPPLLALAPLDRVLMAAQMAVALMLALAVVVLVNRVVMVAPLGLERLLVKEEMGYLVQSLE